MISEEVLSWLDKQIVDISNEEAKKLIIFLAKDIPYDSYDKLIHYIKDSKGKMLMSDDQTK